MASTIAAVRADLRKVASAERAAVSARYFKTGKGEYGEGDVFIGVPVPEVRKVARAHRELPLADVDALLQSKVHEERQAALVILVDRFGRAKKDPKLREQIVKLYLDRLDFVNGWDLVDGSAPHILGAWLVDRDRKLLDRLAASEHLWSRRVAMLATQHFIKQGDADDALRIAERLVADEHDLMHKAVGWMLREIGEYVDLATLRGFLRTHAATMPRTMLRYAIEKLDDDERKRWMTRAPK
ncbi:MAG TPA: DNA alkylation repair protein [Nannocystaceae bacterium]|nr:DNA alkylation repair protein [Nannocystaceae bacterium]